ncbi:AMP-binding protein [Pusillimonas sp. ANT_WB101]|uniref:AMP-binding protein n=1 Tax=Pusillimonas sp. ANT_WB101 TaxID=2597356 RepID=UPI0011EF2304|nr:AMP-binding protein [Pusillimonas sp. ANT_WB101]KAA0891063.1 AMP-binding protein [Pusillimonas sp. ANT_WB101]
MKDIWTQNYPRGVPADITDEAQRYDSLPALFEESCRQFADNVAFSSMGTSISYAELDALTRQFAAWLQNVGVQKGDRVALMMPNLLTYPVCMFGAMRAGAVVVNTNPLYTSSELAHQLADSGAQTLIIAENFAHTLEPVLHKTDVQHIVLATLGDLLGPLKGVITNFAARYIKKLVHRYTLPNVVPLKQALALGRTASYTRPTLTHDDLALLQYTGGTTGVAKGAMLSHGNMVSNVCQAHAWVRPYLKPGQECVVTALPLYHVFALTANCLTFIKLGGRNVLIADARNIAGFVKTLANERFTALTGVNTLFNALLNNPGFASLDFSSLKVTLGGGMAVQTVIAERWLKVTGHPIAQAYGLTEASPAVSLNPLDRTDFDGSIGMPVPSTDIAIRDDDGNDVPQGQSGEICIRGPQVTRGYWNRPEETALVFDSDGYLHTGDIGYINERGYLFINDRKKDMIIVSGFNVYPNEVEAAAMQHPGVLEAAAVGVPDERSGETVKLFVVRKDPNLTQAEVIKHCRSLLTGYKAPKHVEFRDELPHNNVGKILRRELRSFEASAAKRADD